MTASGYRRRQRRKGYPRQGSMLRWQLDVLNAEGIRIGRAARVLVPERLTSAAGPGPMNWRGRAG